MASICIRNGEQTQLLRSSQDLPRLARGKVRHVARSNASLLPRRGAGGFGLPTLGGSTSGRVLGCATTSQNAATTRSGSCHDESKRRHNAFGVVPQRVRTPPPPARRPRPNGSKRRHNGSKRRHNGSKRRHDGHGLRATPPGNCVETLPRTAIRARHLRRARSLAHDAVSEAAGRGIKRT